MCRAARREQVSVAGPAVAVYGDPELAPSAYGSIMMAREQPGLLPTNGGGCGSPSGGRLRRQGVGHGRDAPEEQTEEKLGSRLFFFHFICLGAIITMTRRAYLHSDSSRAYARYRNQEEKNVQYVHLT